MTPVEQNDPILGVQALWQIKRAAPDKIYCQAGQRFADAVFFRHKNPRIEQLLRILQRVTAPMQW